MLRFSEDWLSVDSYLNFLKNTDDSECISIPPVKPKPGEIFVFKYEKFPEDWKADQYRWRNKGNRGLPSDKPVVRCHYFTNFSSHSFMKRAYTIYDENKYYGTRTVVHYVGSMEDVPEVNEPHGNTKEKEPRPFVPSAKSQLQIQKSFISEKYTHKDIYLKLTAAPVPATHTPVLLPRNPKQVTNTVTNEQSRRLLSNDDIIGLYLAGKELQGFVVHLELLPQFAAVLFSHDMVDIFRQQLFSGGAVFYDTTFCLGDCYVSVLSFTCNLFKSHPAIPLAYLLHDRKLTAVHEILFNTIKKHCEDINKTTIVTDREGGINLAIEKTLPEATQLFCWNNIQQDVINWTKKQKNTEMSDCNAYASYVWDLIDSESEEVFDNKYQQLSQLWSAEFLNYVEKHLLQDMKKTAKWVLVELDRYTPFSGITINPSESLNAVLKRFFHFKEVKVQVLALSLYQLDLFYQKEFVRGLCGQGEYILESKYAKQFEKTTEVLKFPESHLLLDQLPYVFTNKDLKVDPSNEEEPYIKYGLAKLLVLQDKVRHIPQEQVFIVSTAENKYMVQLYPKPRCSCSSKTNCHHIQAVNISIGNVHKPTHIIKLNTIMRKNRGYRAGRKKQPKNIKVVEAAEDSRAADPDDPDSFTTSIGIPVKKNNASHVKRRFVTKSNKDLDKTLDVLHEQSVMNPPIASSTPQKQNLSLPVPQNQEDTIQSILTDTFDDKFKRNKEFILLGNQIYPSNLDCLLTNKDANPSDRYLSDTVITTYLSVRNHLEKKMHNNVEIFVCDTLLSFTNDNTYLMKYSFNQFVSYDIAKCDIVLIPVIEHDHCTLFVIIRKTNTIIFLNSLKGKPRKELLNRLISLYNNYYRFCGEAEPEFILYCPKDVPQQKNMYDCGLFVCLFGDVLLKQSLDDLTYIETMECYRNVVLEAVLNAMKADPKYKQGRKRRVVNKKDLANFPIVNEQANLQVRTEPLADGGTMSYLANIINNYWDEKSDVCHNSNCSQPGGNMILCDKCYHWYHTKCQLGLTKNVPRVFTCSNCR